MTQENKSEQPQEQCAFCEATINPITRPSGMCIDCADYFNGKYKKPMKQRIYINDGTTLDLTGASIEAVADTYLWIRKAEQQIATLTAQLSEEKAKHGQIK